MQPWKWITQIPTYRAMQSPNVIVAPSALEQQDYKLLDLPFRSNSLYISLWRDCSQMRTFYCERKDVVC